MNIPLLEPIWWNWYLLGIVLMCLELVIPGSVIVWFGIGALATGLITELSDGLHWALQCIIFCILSLLSLAAGRAMIQMATPSKTTTLNRRLSRYLGKHSTLKMPIVNGSGRIKLEGTYWTIKGPDLPIGTIVEVVAIEDATIVVAKADCNLK